MFDEHGPGAASGREDRPSEAASPGDVLEDVLNEQRRDWMSGRRIRATELLLRFPAFSSNPADAADLIYHEYLLRSELGEPADWEEYLRDFAGYVDRLRVLRHADQFVAEALGVGDPIEEMARLDDYELLEEVGRGGMGVVFKARQKRLNRLVAVKMIRTGEASDKEERRRFENEAQAVARLQHPNIIQIYEVGESNGRQYLALEFVEGQSLARHLDGTPLPVRQAASLVETLARAIDYAHEQQILHRDLKPSNVLVAGTLDRGVLKVSDFGIAKQLDLHVDTRTAAAAGTPSYMAPEQVDMKIGAPDRRTDVYGLGAILYELLTGRPPFRADTPLQTLKQVVEAEPARPRLLNAAVPRDLETVCLKCLRKEPPQRYPSAAALAEDLRRFVQGEPVQARSIGALGRGWRWCRRKPALAALSAVLVLAVLGGLTGILFEWRRAEVARREAEVGDAQVRQLVAELVQASPLDPTMQYSLGFPHTEPLLKAEEHCRQLLEKDPSDASIRIVLTNVYGRLGRLYLQRGASTEAHRVFAAARNLWLSLPDPVRNSESQDWLATTTYWLARSAMFPESSESEALLLRQSADALWQELAEEQPDNLSIIGKATRNLLEIMHWPEVQPAQATRRDLEEDQPLLERLVHDDPANRLLRKRLALRYFLLADVCRVDGSRDEARQYRRNACQQYEILAGTRSDDLSVNLMLALCSRRLIEGQAQDPYYVRAVSLFQRNAACLADLDRQHPDSDWLCDAELEAYCSLAVCHSSAGQQALAEEICRCQVQPLVARLIDQQADPEHALELVRILCRVGSSLWHGKLNAAGLPIARKAADLNSSCAGFSTRDLGFTVALALNADELAVTLQHLGDLSASLQQADLTRSLYQQATDADPSRVRWRVGLTSAWSRIGKVRWDLGQADLALDAFRESTRIQRQLFEADSASAYHRYELDRCYGRLAHWSTLTSDWAGTAAALLEREQLWPDDSDKLMEVSQDFKALAEHMAEGRNNLSAEEQTARQHYLAESERTLVVAEAAARRQKQSLKADR